MKRKVLICMLPFVVTLAGCVQKFDYTPEQSAATAEYMAGLLLKYDSNYKDNLLSEEELIQSKNEAATVTAAPTEAPSQAPADTVTKDGTEASPPIQKVSLSEAIGATGFELQYKNYDLKASYPENASKEVFSITPRQGYQLAVVSFTLTNRSDSKGEVELTTPQYQLDINHGTLYKPQLSLLENDLKYLNMKVAKGDSKTVLLIFEIKKDTEISSMSMTVTNEDKTAEVILK